MILHRWHTETMWINLRNDQLNRRLTIRRGATSLFVQMSHAFTKSYVGRSGHNGRQLVTIHTRNSMPSEMPSKRGVQRAELYTMENQTETRWSLPSRFSHRVRPCKITISPSDFRRNFRWHSATDSFTLRRWINQNYSTGVEWRFFEFLKRIYKTIPLRCIFPPSLFWS